MLSFFKRSKTRNNDKHAASKHQTPRAVHQSDHQPLVVAEGNAAIAVDATPSMPYRNHNTPPSCATAACDYKRREFIGERRDAELPHRSIVVCATELPEPETVASDRRRGANSSTTELDVVGATAVHASRKVEDEYDRVDEEEQRASVYTSAITTGYSLKNKNKNKTSTSLFGGFLGEIMAKGRHRRHNHNNNHSNGGIGNNLNAKNKLHQQQQVQIQPQVNSKTLVQDTKNVESNEASKPYLNEANNRYTLKESTPVISSDHLNSSANLCSNDNFYATNERLKSPPRPQTQLQCDDSLDFDPTSKNSPVEFIDDDDDECERSPNQADTEPTLKCAPKNSTTERGSDSISSSPLDTVVAAKDHRSIDKHSTTINYSENGDNSDHDQSINDPDIVNAHSNHNNNYIDQRYQQQRIPGSQTTDGGGGDLRHVDCDDIRQNANTTTTTRELGKNSPTSTGPCDHTIVNAVAENTTGASPSSDGEILSKTVDYLRSDERSPELLSSVSVSSIPPPPTTSGDALIKPIPTITDRAPLAALSDDEFDDFEHAIGDKIHNYTNNNELDLNSHQEDLYAANVIIACQQMGQQPTKPSANPGAAHPDPISSSTRTTSHNQPIPKSPPQPPNNFHPSATPDDIFYEAGEFSPAQSSVPLDIRPAPNSQPKPPQQEFSPSTASSDRLLYSEPKSTTENVANLSECNTINCTESRANINNGDRFVPANAAPSRCSTESTASQLPEEQHHESNDEDDANHDNEVDDDEYEDDGDDDNAGSVGDEATTHNTQTTHTVENDNEHKQNVISLHHPSNQNTDNTDDEYDCCEDDDDEEDNAEEDGDQEHDHQLDTVTTTATVDGRHSSASSSDDPENDSPDSGIDVVADIADISRILTKLESCGGGVSAAESSDLASRDSLAVNGGGGLSVASDHLVRSTSSGLESDLSDDQCEKSSVNQKEDRRAFTGESKDNKDEVLRKSNDLVVRGSIEVSADCATKRVRSGISDSSGVSADDTIAISLPDIVESTGSSTSPGGGGNTMVSSGVQHVGTMADTSCSSASESENGDGGVDEQSQQELIEEKMRDLVNQEARFSQQLEEAEKQAYDSKAKANDLSYQISELERNLLVKIWNVERLQAELQAAYQEGECVKRKVKQQEADIEAQRRKFSSREEELESQYINLETQHKELQHKLEQLESLTSSLQAQLSAAQNDVTAVRLEKEKCQQEHAKECAKLQAAIEATILEKTQLEVKWQKEFEQLRTHHSDREEHLLQDCEWKLRTTEQACKAKMTAAEEAKNEALARASKVETDAHRQIDEVKHLRSYEAEVCQLRGLTSAQSESIVTMTDQLRDLKEELKEANQTVAESIETVRKIKFQCEQEISDKHRQMINKIDEARGDVAVMWEDRLMEEMSRLKVELESCYAEDRAEALHTAQTESLAEIAALKELFSAKEAELYKEIAELKLIVSQKHSQLEDANERSDKQVMQIRMILDRSEREHEREMSAEIAKREELAESMRLEKDTERQRTEEIFRERLQQVSAEFATELANTNEDHEARHKKLMEQQYEKLMADKEETVQNLVRTHKRKSTDWETKLRDIEIDHQRDIKDMKSQLSMQRSSFEQRDTQSAQEIDQLHKKCKCLTKLFEEMRMRYERRDPRPEDLREIEEMKSRLETQDRELSQMTEQLRKYQLNSRQQPNQNQQQQQQHQQQQQQNNSQQSRKQKNKNNKSKVNNCNVIYEENEDREASPKSNGFFAKTVEL